jgi:hypothetical protein
MPYSFDNQQHYDDSQIFPRHSHQSKLRTSYSITVILPDRPAPVFGWACKVENTNFSQTLKRFIDCQTFSATMPRSFLFGTGK